MPKSVKKALKSAKAPIEIIHPHKEIHIKKGEIVKITPDMVIGDVIMAYPEAAGVMMEMGIHCVGCHGALFESIEEGAAIHGLDPRKICDEINRILQKSAPNKKKK